MKVLYVLRLNVEFPLNLCEKVSRKEDLGHKCDQNPVLSLARFYEGCPVE